MECRQTFMGFQIASAACSELLSCMPHRQTPDIQITRWAGRLSMTSTRTRMGLTTCVVDHTATLYEHEYL
eukprot:scaffold212793_cov31-Prasinocladus_malaysianus.AAC.1